MPKEAAKTLKIPGFRYMGFDVPAIDMPTSLIDNLGTSKPAYELAPKSTPLAWRVALYTIGRDLSLGIEDADALPTPVKEAGKLVYSDAQARKGRGGWHKDGYLFLPRSDKPKGMWPMPDDYALAKAFIDIKGFKEKNGKWEIDTNSDTKEEYIWLPEGGGSFVAPPTKYEITPYNPVTGTPFETISDRNEAVKRWASAGLTEEQAEKGISRFYRRNSGTAAVCSWSVDYSGPLCIDLGDGPWNWYRFLGSFPASRAAERSEAVKNSGYRILTKEEYASFETDRKRRAELESGMRELLAKQ